MQTSWPSTPYTRICSFTQNGHLVETLRKKTNKKNVHQTGIPLLCPSWALVAEIFFFFFLIQTGNPISVRHIDLGDIKILNNQ